MAGFPGGSAWAAAKDIAEGYVLVTERTFSRYEAAQLDQLAFEIDRALRDARGQQAAIDDTEAVQERNRKLMRLKGALSILRSHQQKRFRRGTRPKFDGNA